MVRIAQFNHSETPPPSIWGEKGDQLKVKGEYEESNTFIRGELNIIPWYSASWVVLYRPIYRYTADKLADAAEAAARNPNIGYSQTNDRESLYREMLQSQPEKVHPADVKTKCNSDCSAGFAALSTYAGIYIPADNWTGNMRQNIRESGGYLTAIDPEYLARPDFLLPGDVLLRPATPEVGGHTLTVIEVGEGVMEYAGAHVKAGRWNMRRSPAIYSDIIREYESGVALEVYLPAITDGSYHFYYVIDLLTQCSGYMTRACFEQDFKLEILRDTWLRSDPNLDGGCITVVPEGAYVLNSGKKQIDSRGVFWYRVAYSNKWGWISAKNSEIVL